MTTHDTIISMIALPLVIDPKVGSSYCLLIICHAVGIREKPSTRAIITPDRIACSSLVSIFIPLLFMVVKGYSSIL